MVTNTAEQHSRPRIGELLVSEGLITPGQLREALAMQKSEGGKTVENLIALKYLDMTDFIRFVSHQPGVASIDVLNYTIPPDVIALVPAEFAIQHEALPIDKMGSRLTVGMACPLDEQTIHELEEMTGLRVRPLLVGMNDIHVALKNYYPPDRAKMAAVEETPAAVTAAPPTNADLAKVQTSLTFEQVLNLVRKVTSLPALPETVSRVRTAIEDPDSTVADIAEIIAVDPGLAAKVISLANSPAFGFAHRVDSVERAVALIGMKEIYGLVVSTAVIEYFDQDNRFDFRQFWRRSMACAAAARVMARSVGVRDRGGAFAAGLLHDLGRAVLAHTLPEQYGELDHEVTDDSLIETEGKLFGISHPEVGFVLAEAWDLPDELAEPIRFHHALSFAEKCKDRVALVSLAANTVDHLEALKRDNGDALNTHCREALSVLSLSDKQFMDLLPEVEEAVAAGADQ